MSGYLVTVAPVGGKGTILVRSGAGTRTSNGVRAGEPVPRAGGRACAAVQQAERRYHGGKPPGASLPGVSHTQALPGIHPLVHSLQIEFYFTPADGLLWDTVRPGGS